VFFFFFTFRRENLASQVQAPRSHRTRPNAYPDSLKFPLVAPKTQERALSTTNRATAHLISPSPSSPFPHHLPQPRPPPFHDSSYLTSSLTYHSSFDVVELARTPFTVGQLQQSRASGGFLDNGRSSMIANETKL